MQNVPSLGSVKHLDLYTAEPTQAFVKAVERLSVDMLCLQAVGAEGPLTFTRNAKGKLAPSKA
ncbi:MAG: hypothetical protein Q8N26_12045 [Myxococcales bacterium]|nr:hypothetical protein [Myxococcales bacterium]